METVSEINLSHSERRPRAQAWCASSGGRKTYAGTREEALSRHKNALEAGDHTALTLKCCADYTLCPERS